MRLRNFNGKVILGLLFILFFWVAMFWQVFIKGYVAMPNDLLVGAYYPWLNSKWGYEVGVPVKNPEISDVFSQVFVWKKIIRESIRSGEFPLWNKYDMSGSPLMASLQPAVFFPTTLLTTFLPIHIGWNAHIMLSSLVGMMGLFIYLKIRKIGNLSSLLSSILFVTGSLMTTWVEIGTTVWAMAMLPWIFWTIDKFLNENKLKYLIGLSLFITLVIFAGHAQMIIYGVVLVAVYGVVMSGRSLRNILLIWLFLFAGIGLSAIQLLPTLDLYQNSIRNFENYSAGMNHGLIPWTQLIRVWVADFYGNPVTGNYSHYQSYHETSLYLGILVVPLILPFFLIGRKAVTSEIFDGQRYVNETSDDEKIRINKFKLINWWLFVWVISIFLVIDNPISSFFYHQQFHLLNNSFASRLLFVTNLASSILCGLGLNELITNRQFRMKSKWVSIAVIILTIIVYWYVGQMWKAEQYKIAFKNGLIPLGLLIFYAFLLAIKFVNGKVIGLIILVIVSGTQLSYFWKYNPFTDVKLMFPSTASIEFLRKDKTPFRIARVRNPLLPPNTWGYYGIESVEGYNPLHLLNYSNYFRLLEGAQYGGSVSRYLELEKFNPKYLAAMNVKYVVTLANNPAIDVLKKYGYEEVFTENQVYIFENKTPIGRIYFVNQLRSLSGAELIRQLNNYFFDPQNEALIIDNNDTRVFFSEDRGLDIQNIKANHLQFETNSSSDQFLVVAQAYDKGWKSYINGKPKQNLLVNGGITGILLPVGENRIKMVYWPDSVSWGIGITILFVGILIIFSLFAGTKKQLSVKR